MKNNKKQYFLALCFFAASIFANNAIAMFDNDNEEDYQLYDPELLILRAKFIKEGSGDLGWRAAFAAIYLEPDAFDDFKNTKPIILPGATEESAQREWEKEKKIHESLQSVIKEWQKTDKPRWRKKAFEKKKEEWKVVDQLHEDMDEFDKEWDDLGLDEFLDEALDDEKKPFSLSVKAAAFRPNSYRS